MTQASTSLSEIKTIFFPSVAKVLHAAQDLCADPVSKRLERWFSVKGDITDYELAYPHVGMIFGALLAFTAYLLTALYVPELVAATIAVLGSVLLGGEIPTRRAKSRTGQRRRARLWIVMVTAIWRALALAAALSTQSALFASIGTTAVAFLLPVFVQKKPASKINPVDTLVLFILLVMAFGWLFTPITTVQFLLFAVFMIVVLPLVKTMLPSLTKTDKQAAIANGMVIVSALMWLVWIIA